ncbi:MAG: hypothetical protein ACKOZV_14265, partial [Bacteroidota bacterium]
QEIFLLEAKPEIRVVVVNRRPTVGLVNRTTAVESSEHRLSARASIPLFILHGTFRGALPA